MKAASQTNTASVAHHFTTGLGQGSVDDGATDWQQLFLSLLGTISSLCHFTARRYRLSNSECEDLYSAVCFHLIANDYAVIRKFSGRGSMRGYLAIVIRRVLLDRRVSELGKWRASAAAKRNGRTAIIVEGLIRKNGMSLDEACETFRSNFGGSMTETEKEKIASCLSRRGQRRFVDISALPEASHPSPTPLEQLALKEDLATTRHAKALLTRALAALGEEDRRLLELRYQRGKSTANISRELRLDQRVLYRRFERMLAGLRVELEGRGIRRQDLVFGC